MSKEKVKEETPKVEEVQNGEQVIVDPTDGTQDSNPQEGIDLDNKQNKAIIADDKKAKDAVNNGDVVVNSTTASEIQKPMVKDYLSDRPVYETASQAMAALSAAGKLTTPDK